MTTVQFLNHLRDKNIKVWIEGEKLRFRAPNDVLTAELRAELTQRKPEMMRLLQELVDDSADIPAILRSPREREIPLSFAQQQLWLLAQMKGASEAYHVSGGIRLRGNLDLAALRSALNRILARHEALRTTFGLIEGEPTQIISPVAESRFLLVEHDLRLDTNFQAALDALANEEAAAPFDLETGPLVRGRLIRCADQEYILLVTMHHIVSDGWSMGILANELSVLYAVFREGRKDPLPELDIQYADYAIWQRRWVQGDTLQKQAQYWKAALADAPALLQLPADRPRPTQHDFAGAFAKLVLDKQLTSALRDLSRRCGTTLFMTLLAAWAALLSRLSGQQDVVIGTPITNRGRAETEALIGFFVNTLALRLDLSGSPTVHELLDQAKAQTLAAQRHQDIPFEQVIAVIQPQRTLSYNPIFQVMFAWQNWPESSVALPGLEVTLLPSPQRSAKFDLTLFLQESGDTISGGIEYATSLFEAGTVQRYVGYLHNLLQAMVVADSQAMDRLPMLSDAERHRVLYEWNDTKSAFPSQLCTHDLFEEQVARSPDAIAVIFQERQITYAELNRSANQVACYLRELGVRPDALVAICMERGIEMIVALLGVLKAGGAYVPLDPEYPIDRLRFVLEDCAPAVLLTQTSLLSLFPHVSDTLPVVDLLAERATWLNLPGTNLGSKATGLNPHHLAYVIYTSGSTGKPKGVMVEHKGLVNFLWSMRQSPGIGPSDVLLAVTTFAFDIVGLDFYLPLITGARFILLSRDASVDGHRLLGELRRGITMLQATPTSWRMLLEAGWKEKETDNLKVLCGGEALSSSLAQSLLTRSGSVWNMYGPTETTVWPLAKKLNSWKDSVSIGRPIANTQVYILDSQRQPVPIGVVGEIYIGGAGVARGYLNRPELTEERFLKDPFSADAGARMYRTGDLGRWMADGNVEFLGRNDFQVKIRGFRIELGEIEAQLAKHPGVREAVALTREDTPGDKILMAYYTPRNTSAQGEPSLTVDQLHSFLLASLPEYMVPTAYIRLDALPLLPNGKLDRKALSAPSQDAYVTHAYEPPKGQTEAMLASIWREVLKCGRIGRNDNFFALGGHSLLVMRVVQKIRESLRVEIPASALFETPTIAGLAEQVSGRIDVAQPSRQFAMLRTECDKDPILAPQQEIWWYQEQRTGSVHPNSIEHVVRLSGQLNMVALEQSVAALQRRHEALRTSFQPCARGGAVPIISPAATSPVHLSMTDLSALEERQREQSLLRIIHLENSRPFDLTRSPLFRVTAVRLQPDDHALIFTLHHIISDEWSLGILMSDLSKLYQCFVAGHPASLPELEFQYLDFARWQYRWLTSRDFAGPLKYWIQQLGPPLGELFPPIAGGEASAESLLAIRERRNIVIPHPVIGAARRLARSNSCSLFCTIVTALKALLFIRTGQPDVRIGTMVANRSIFGSEKIVGLFANPVCLRTNIALADRFQELVKSVHERIRDATLNQEVPFDVVTHALDVAFGIPRGKLFSVMVLWHANPSESISLPGLRLDRSRWIEDLNEEGTVLVRKGSLEILFELNETDTDVRGTLTYRQDRFDHRQILELVADLNLCVTLADQHPGVTIGEMHDVLQSSPATRFGLKPSTYVNVSCESAAI
jgi:amino acid adenylation domain-containing protein